MTDLDLLEIDPLVDRQPSQVAPQAVERHLHGAKTRGAIPTKSLMFRDPDMPVGDALLNGVKASRTALIEKIFSGRS